MHVGDSVGVGVGDSDGGGQSGSCGNPYDEQTPFATGSGVLVGVGGLVLVFFGGGGGV